jgi:hypothetical protein
MPANVYPIIFGAKWFKTEWNPSRQLVWASGEVCFIPLISRLLVNAAFVFSYTVESAIGQKANYELYNNKMVAF